MAFILFPLMVPTIALITIIIIEKSVKVSYYHQGFTFLSHCFPLQINNGLASLLAHLGRSNIWDDIQLFPEGKILTF
jgi:hypothetical protein